MIYAQLAIRTQEGVSYTEAKVIENQNQINEILSATKDISRFFDVSLLMQYSRDDSDFDLTNRQAKVAEESEKGSAKIDEDGRIPATEVAVQGDAIEELSKNYTFKSGPRKKKSATESNNTEHTDIIE